MLFQDKIRQLEQDLASKGGECDQAQMEIRDFQSRVSNFEMQIQRMQSELMEAQSWKEQYDYQVEETQRLTAELSDKEGQIWKKEDDIIRIQELVQGRDE